MRALVEQSAKPSTTESLQLPTVILPSVTESMDQSEEAIRSAESQSEDNNTSMVTSPDRFFNSATTSSTFTSATASEEMATATASDPETAASASFPRTSAADSRSTVTTYHQIMSATTSDEGRHSTVSKQSAAATVPQGRRLPSINSTTHVSITTAGTNSASGSTSAMCEQQASSRHKKPPDRKYIVDYHHS